jgi:Tol biopolymer transport system component
MSELEILDLVRASARADGSEARPYSRHGGNSPIGTADPSISADGSKVAFTSDFLDLIPNDTNGNSDIFVRDLTTGAIERANTTADGAPSETGSPLTLPEMVAGGASLSADGTKIAFWSVSPDLVPDDTNGTSDKDGNDIFVKDLVTGAITRASTTASGGQTVDTPLLQTPSLSAGGSIVAFISNASDLVQGDTNGNSDIFVKDLTTGAVVRANTAADGAQGNGYYNRFPVLSADGTKIVFTSDAGNLVPDDTNNKEDVFVKDLLTGTIIRANTAADGSQANGLYISGASISANGTKVAFGDDANNLVPADTNDRSDVFIKDLATGGIERVSVASDGTQESSNAFFSSLSANGTRVAYRTEYFTHNESTFHSDLMLKDMETGDTLKIAENSYAASLSADGSEIAFLSYSPNLVAGDNAGEQDVFVARLASGDDRVLHGTKKADMLEGGVGNDVIYGQNGDDVLRSYSGDDRIRGGNGRDALDGGLGNDSLRGGNGNDRIDGGQGDDHLWGGNGSDWLRGGPGLDKLHGGAGADTFVIDSETSSPVGHGDVIEDFSSISGDRIDLFAVLFANSDFGSPIFLKDEGAPFDGGPFSSPLVRWERSGSDVLIQAELDGDNSADLEFTLNGVNSVSEIDFIL